MQKFHPLTEKIYPPNSIPWDSSRKEFVDTIIRTELEKMAKEIYCHRDNEMTVQQLDEILGLSTESEPDERCKHGVHGTDCFKCFDQEENPKPKTAEEWCYHLQNRGEGLKLYQDGANKSHILGQSHTTYFQFCPICGAPRPTEKTLEQKFREYLFTRYPLIKNDDVVWLVKTAEEHYGGKKS
jgi:hypothetical protein